MTFYQSTKSKTRFESVTPDDEGIGLDDFHKPEENVVRLFSEGDANALVMGGISATGKTYILKKLREALRFDFVDLHMVGQHIRNIDRLGPAKVAQEILDARTATTESARGLILDDGISGLIADGQTSPSHRIDEVVVELLQKYHKLIICGGGTDYTSEEQTEMMVEALPRELKVATHPFPLKTLNFRQTADLAQRAKLGIYQDGDPTEKLLPRELAELIAETQLQYFRLLKETIKIAYILSWPDPRIGEIESNIRNRIMPDDNFKRAWDTQRSAFNDIRQTLADMLKQ